MEIVGNNHHKIIQGDAAKKQYKSIYEPILFYVSQIKNYTLNIYSILVNAKTGTERKIVNCRKVAPKVYDSKKVPRNVRENARVCYCMHENKNHPTQKPFAVTEHITKQVPFNV
jgi:adenine-specific DNA-methyltransferase